MGGVSTVGSLIGDIFTLAKEAFALRAMHRNARLSVTKFIVLNVPLIGANIFARTNRKNLIQSVAER